MFVRLSVRPRETTRLPLDGFPLNLTRIFRKPVEKTQVSLRYDENDGYFTGKPLYIFYLSPSVHFRMRNASDNSYRENQNTHFMFNNNRPPPSNILLFIRYCGRTWRAGQAKNDNIVQRARFAWRMSKDTNTHSGYVIFIAFHCNNVCKDAP